MDIVIVLGREGELLQIIDALNPPRRLARRLNGGKQQGNQNGDDRDDHEKLDQRERTPMTWNRDGILEHWNHLRERG